MAEPFIRLEPFMDFDESFVLKKGQRAPKGYKVVTLNAACFPPGWPEGKLYKCKCGCGKSNRIGDRVAVKNARQIGLVPSGTLKWKK
jgi:hypothetical protein